MTPIITEDPYVTARMASITARMASIGARMASIAARMASIGGMPNTRTHRSSACHVERLWKFIGMPLSVPMRSVTPASHIWSNLRFGEGRRCRVS